MEVNRQIVLGYKLKSLTAGKTSDDILTRNVIMKHV